MWKTCYFQEIKSMWNTRTDGRYFRQEIFQCWRNTNVVAYAANQLQSSTSCMRRLLFWKETDVCQCTCTRRLIPYNRRRVPYVCLLPKQEIWVSAYADQLSGCLCSGGTHISIIGNDMDAVVYPKLTLKVVVTRQEGKGWNMSNTEVSDIVVSCNSK